MEGINLRFPLDFKQREIPSTIKPEYNHVITFPSSSSEGAKNMAMSGIIESWKKQGSRSISRNMGEEDREYLANMVEDYGRNPANVNYWINLCSFIAYKLPGKYINLPPLRVEDDFPLEGIKFSPENEQGIKESEEKFRRISAFLWQTQREDCSIYDAWLALKKSGEFQDFVPKDFPPLNAKDQKDFTLEGYQRVLASRHWSPRDYSSPREGFHQAFLRAQDNPILVKYASSHGEVFVHGPHPLSISRDRDLWQEKYQGWGLGKNKVYESLREECKENAIYSSTHKSIPLPPPEN